MESVTDYQLNELARDIVEKFEDLLDSKDIEIPCSDETEQNERHWLDNDARIYGVEYYNLVDEIQELLYKVVNT